MKFVAYGVSFFFVLLIGWFVLTDFNFMEEEGSASDVPDFIFEGISLYEFKQGQLVTSLNAKEAYIKDNDIYMKDFLGYFFSEVSSSFFYQALSGVYGFQDQYFKFYDFKARIPFESDELVLSTGRFYWYLHSDVMKADQGVRALYHDAIFESQVLYLNHSLQRLFFREDIRVETYL
eukprot:COSAG01_NODE_216_length_21695_cov_83.368772_13_plen_177_part_00